MWKNHLCPGRNSLPLREIHSSWSEPGRGLKKKREMSHLIVWGGPGYSTVIWLVWFKKGPCFKSLEPENRPLWGLGLFQGACGRGLAPAACPSEPGQVRGHACPVRMSEEDLGCVWDSSVISGSPGGTGHSLLFSLCPQALFFTPHRCFWSWLEKGTQVLKGLASDSDPALNCRSFTFPGGRSSSSCVSRCVPGLFCSELLGQSSQPPWRAVYLLMLPHGAAISQDQMLGDGLASSCLWTSAIALPSSCMPFLHRDGSLLSFQALSEAEPHPCFLLVLHGI